MNDHTDAVIEATSKKFSEMFGGEIEDWHPTARAFAAAGLLVNELPVEPPPVGQMRRSPNGQIVAIRANEIVIPWNCSDRVARDDYAVRDWPILVPETDLNDLRAERDRLVEAAKECTVFLRGIDANSLRRLEREGNRPGCGASAVIAGYVARAELDRRAAEEGRAGMNDPLNIEVQ